MFPGKNFVTKCIGKAYFIMEKDPNKSKKMQSLWIHETNYRRKHHLTEIPRLIGVNQAPNKQRRRREEIRVRNYAQHQAAFYSLNVLASRKVIIPLR